MALLPVGVPKVLTYKRRKIERFKKKLCKKYPSKYEEWMCLARVKNKEIKGRRRCIKPCISGALRCKFHGGLSPGPPIKSGKYSIRSRGRFLPLYEKFLADGNALNLLDEIALLRTFIVEILEMEGEAFSKQQKVELIEKVTNVIDVVGKMAERLRKIHVSYFSMESLAIVVQQLINLVESNTNVCPSCGKDLHIVREKLASEILSLNIPGLEKKNRTIDTDFVISEDKET